MLRALALLVTVSGSAASRTDARPLRTTGVAASQPEPLEQTWQLGPLRVTCRVSHRSPLVSDLVNVSFEIEAPAGVDVKFRSAGDQPKDVRVRNTRQTQSRLGSPGPQIWRTQFDLDALLPGVYEFPALELSYRTSPDADWTIEATEPLTLEFRSLLGDRPDEAEPKPNPDPVALPARPIIWWAIAGIVALIVLVAGAAAAVLILRTTRPRPSPRISAYRKAMNALDRIERASWLERAELDRFYTELSAVVRHYVEDRFGLRAPERTTEELLHELSARPVLGHDQSLALGRFLEQCDLVKFARVRPAVAEGPAAMHAARRFIDATRDDSVTVEP